MTAIRLELWDYEVAERGGAGDGAGGDGLTVSGKLAPAQRSRYWLCADPGRATGRSGLLAARRR